MIEINKQYRTRAGQVVRILAVDVKAKYPVIVAVVNGNVEEVYSYTPEGRCYIDSTDENPLDLIEVSPYDGFEIDDPVMVRDFNDKMWQPRHFAGLTSDGSPTTWAGAGTSWTTPADAKIVWVQCRRPTLDELLARNHL